MRVRSVLLPGLAAVVVAVLGLALRHTTPAASAASASQSTAVVRSATARIKIANFAYEPATLTVKIGTKITVTNTDHTAHTLTARSGRFDTGTLKPGKSGHFVVTKPGVYAYYCQFHAFMAGTLKVIK